MPAIVCIKVIPSRRDNAKGIEDPLGILHSFFFIALFITICPYAREGSHELQIFVP